MWSPLRSGSWRDSSFAVAAGDIQETKQGLCQVLLRSFCYDFVCLKHTFLFTYAQSEHQREVLLVTQSF